MKLGVKIILIRNIYLRFKILIYIYSIIIMIYTYDAYKLLDMGGRSQSIF